MAQGIFRSVSMASNSGAPGRGRTESIWARYSSPCQTCSKATSSLDSVRPVSRSSADTNRPPLIPIRRWIRHTDRSMFSRDSAVRQAITCWYTLSISVPSRSNRNAGAGGIWYASSSVMRSVCRAPTALRGLARWIVVAEDAAVGAGGGGGAVRVEPQRPAPGVDDDEMVEGANGAEVFQGRGPAPGSGDEVVDLAGSGRDPAAGEAAAPMAGEYRPAQVPRDGAFGLAGVQRQRYGQRHAGRGAGAAGELGGAQPGCQPAGAGHHVGGQAEHRLPQPGQRRRRQRGASGAGAAAARAPATG